MSTEEEKGKRKASDEGDDSGTKKPRLEEDVEQGGGTSGEGPLKGGARSDSDEEYEVGSGNEGSEQEGYSSVEEGDSSEVEDEDESGGGEDNTSIVCGLGVKMRIVKDGKYRLFHQQEGRELKMIISEEDRVGAMQATLEKQNNNLIPLLEAKGIDVAKDDNDELIVYVTSLSMSNEEYPYLGLEQEEEGEEETEGEVMLQNNSLAVIKLEDFDEMFATGDLLDSDENQ